MNIYDVRQGSFFLSHKLVSGRIRKLLTQMIDICVKRLLGNKSKHALGVARNCNIVSSRKTAVFLFYR